MARTNFQELLDAGAHFGHLKRKWSPSMAPYIFMEKNGIHIIDLHKTVAKIDDAASALKQIAQSGRKILFVATKKQAKEILAEKISAINMPYVAERWPGGMLTNFPTIRKAVKKMSSIDRMFSDGTSDHLSKREKLQITRQRAKLEKNLGSIADLTRLPAAMFVVDILKENIAVREAKRLNIPVFAMVDTNSNPKDIDFIIPANDDATKSISLVLDKMCDAIKEGLTERKAIKDKEPARENKSKSAKKDGLRPRKNAAAKAEAKKEEKVSAKVEKEVVAEKKAPAKKASVKKATAAKKAPAKKAVAKKETATEKKAPAKKAPAKKVAAKKPAAKKETAAKAKKSE